MWQVGDARRCVLGLVVRGSLHLSLNAQQIGGNSDCTHNIDALGKTQINSSTRWLNQARSIHERAHFSTRALYHWTVSKHSPKGKALRIPSHSRP